MGVSLCVCAICKRFEDELEYDDNENQKPCWSGCVLLDDDNLYDIKKQYVFDLEQKLNVRYIHGKVTCENKQLVAPFIEENLGIKIKKFHSDLLYELYFKKLDWLFKNRTKQNHKQYKVVEGFIKNCMR